MKLMVTGPRLVEYPTVVQSRLSHLLRFLQPSIAISGGAQGVDTIFAESALELGIPLKLMIPNIHYLAYYSQAISSDSVSKASEVKIVVDRPYVEDWKERWASERWFVDNFERNTAMIKESTDTIIVSHVYPHELMSDRKGGTANCVRSLAKIDPDREVIWVPDNPDVEIPPPFTLMSQQDGREPTLF